MNIMADAQADPVVVLADELALRHQLEGLTRKTSPIVAWAKLEEVKPWLTRALTAAAHNDASNASAAEWLLDNDFEVQRALLQIDESLPRGFYDRLPGIAGRDKIYPRVYDLAHGLLQAAHLQLAVGQSIRFIAAYQARMPLTMAELWAFPTMLRIACIELLAAGFSALFENVPPPFPADGTAYLHLPADPTECVARAIANLGVIAGIQWKDFFDQTSRTEAILCHDPADVYPHMDFDTRDRYRHAIEKSAELTRLDEWDVAERAIAHARQSRHPPLNHVGYWLIGEGQCAFEDELGVRRSGWEAVTRRLARYPTHIYALALVVVGVIGLVLPGLYLASVHPSPEIWVVGLLLSAIPSSIISVTFVNWLVNLIVSPRVLPKLDFDKGLAPDCTTVVIMPVIIAKPDNIDGIMRRLESHYLANADPILHFTLLSDVTDADRARCHGDEEIEQALIAGVDILNARYGRDGKGPFVLLHRHRLHNPAQGCWMGWERKRGKIEQFNHFLLTGDASAFPVTAGEVSALHGTRFVVTADADTRLPPGVVNHMVGTLAHPLNRAHFDPRSDRVTMGYTILQPRVEIAPDVERQSFFTRFFGSDTAIDIYSRAVSDVYQDLSGSGIFIGKGIYEVASFARSLAGVVPDNSLLSHDLFEGLHGRAGLATDIIIYEGFPDGYLDHARRSHRWIRGDWQILLWLLPFVPGHDRKWRRNRLGWFDRLKIVDNLRRSIAPIATMMLLLGGWLILPGNPLVWTLLAIAAPGAYLFTDLMSEIASIGHRGTWRSMTRRFLIHLGRWSLVLVFLANDAAIALHAIAVTLYRLIARRHLLEWTSAAQMAEHFASSDPRRIAWREMRSSPVAAVIIGVLVCYVSPQALGAALPLVLLWIAAPEIATWIALPLRTKEETLTAPDRLFLRKVARRTWLYFETFVRPDDNWLPPDNYQEPPYEEIAHRTSPTNVGVMLLAALTAWRLGHIDLSDLAVRLRNTLDTLDRLERYRGHMLNWYDTRTLQPLDPRYVSTVDSGNLAASLITLSAAMRDADFGPVTLSAAWDGLLDELMLIDDALEGLDAADAARKLLAHIINIMNRPLPITGHAVLLQQLTTHELPALRTAIHDMIVAAGLPAGPAAELRLWVDRFDHHLHSLRRDEKLYRPWLAVLEDAPTLFATQAERLAANLAREMPLNMVAETIHAARMIVEGWYAPPASDEDHWRQNLINALEEGVNNTNGLRVLLQELADRTARWAHDMEFGFLFDASRRLFHIGYSVSADRIDAHHYDLLASEARLASFFAIAKGDVPVEHWFFLGRPITRKAAGLALVSWNGSMFEYLMPSLFLRSDPRTLLGQSDRTAIDMQRLYGDNHGTPWGISESAYAIMGSDRAYRYHAFGVPGLGLRRGLERDHVVAPYASLLALAVRTCAAIRNLRRLEALGMMGRYGFFEAIDFTPGRALPGEHAAIVQSYMVHHHGMSLAAIGNALCDDMLVRWFHTDPHIQTVELLLNERIPWELPPELAHSVARELAPAPVAVAAVPGLYPWTPDIETHDLQGECLHAIGNGRMTTRFGAGGSGVQWQGHAITASTPGPWLYLHEPASGEVWHAMPDLADMPLGDASVVFHAERVECHHRAFGLAVTTEITVAHADDLEIRRVTLVNETDQPRTLILTNIAEVVLAPVREAARHPAFSKMFVCSETLPRLNGLLFTRRPRAPSETPPVLLHRVLGDRNGLTLTSFETDRAAFLGRHGSNFDPAAMKPDARAERLHETSGWTLDPAMALRVVVHIPPHGRIELAYLTIAAPSRTTAIEIAERYATHNALQWAMADAAAHAARDMYRIGIAPHALPDASRLVARMIGADLERTAITTPVAIPPARAALWSLGISGDDPIILLRVGDGSKTAMLRSLLAGQKLCQLRGAPVDLVVLHEGDEGYVDPVRERLIDCLRENDVQDRLGLRGGIHLIGRALLKEGLLKDAMVAMLERAARLMLTEDGPNLIGQMELGRILPVPRPHFGPIAPVADTTPTPPLPRLSDLLLDNGTGGFSPIDGSYVIQLDPGQTTPAPWANVLANDGFGTIVTEAGLGFSWAVNAGENRITPWSNDPVRDPQTECLYLRDEENGHLWTISPAPIGPSTHDDDGGCRIRHAAGHSIWERASEGLEQEMLAFVAPDDPIKIVRVRLRNLRPRARRITATYYAQWLLGSVTGENGALRCAEYDPALHALLAVNPWSDSFGQRVAFLTASEAPHSVTTSCAEFLGPRRRTDQPEALQNWDLGGRLQAVGDDCCAAYQLHVDIGPNETRDVFFILGQGEDRTHAAQLVAKWQDPDEAEHALAATNAQYQARLEAITVATPEPAFDLLINRWLPYQALNSRIRARAGFYQAGGAFGFRDQLQDVLALRFADPGLARRHILEAAAHQFEEGDVLHWWHPPAGAGVRTRCSDDMLWLPFATCTYIEATGDRTILAEQVRYLRAAPLAADEGDRYAQFDTAPNAAKLFDHLERALEHAYQLGRHGLPLIGAGDWNDGMNRIGEEGRGESVWLGWFLIKTIHMFAPICAAAQHPEIAIRWLRRAEELTTAIETTSWDGNWYSRAFDDQGRPWGTATESECQIDSIAQSWAQLSGAGRPERIKRALASAKEHLVRADDQIVRLLDPPFNLTPREPGYIKSYPPGIRENGGQYTHAAAWLGMAMAQSGDGDGAMEIFRRINPICQTMTPAQVRQYRIEPYVVAGDVGGSGPHLGRGGWSWYTGAAAWTWRLGVEEIMGLQIMQGKLHITPHLPTDWPEASATLRHPGGSLQVHIDNRQAAIEGPTLITVNGNPWPEGGIPFPEDGGMSQVRVQMRRAGVDETKT